jgi:hypothetical protein
MAWTYEWTFLLVLGFPATIAANLLAAYFGYQWTNGASTTRQIKIRIRTLVCSAAALSIVACLASLSTWLLWSGPVKAGLSQDADQALWVGQVLTALGLTVAVIVAASAGMGYRQTTSPPATSN